MCREMERPACLSDKPHSTRVYCATHLAPLLVGDLILVEHVGLLELRRDLLFAHRLANRREEGAELLLGDEAIAVDIGLVEALRHALTNEHVGSHSTATRGELRDSRAE